MFEHGGNSVPPFGVGEVIRPCNALDRVYRRLACFRKGARYFCLNKTKGGQTWRWYSMW